MNECLTDISNSKYTGLKPALSTGFFISVDNNSMHPVPEAKNPCSHNIPNPSGDPVG
jgi:hypothetical protein